MAKALKNLVAKEHCCCKPAVLEVSVSHQSHLAHLEDLKKNAAFCLISKVSLPVARLRKVLRASKNAFVGLVCKPVKVLLSSNGNICR